MMMKEERDRLIRVHEIWLRLINVAYEAVELAMESAPSPDYQGGILTELDLARSRIDKARQLAHPELEHVKSIKVFGED